jgi:hypothetical protein
MASQVTSVQRISPQQLGDLTEIGRFLRQVFKGQHLIFMDQEIANAKHLPGESVSFLFHQGGNCGERVMRDFSKTSIMAKRQHLIVPLPAGDEQRCSQQSPEVRVKKVRVRPHVIAAQATSFYSQGTSLVPQKKAITTIKFSPIFYFCARLTFRKVWSKFLFSC